MGGCEQGDYGKQGSGRKEGMKRVLFSFDIERMQEY